MPQIDGTSKDDLLYGTVGDDTIFGGAGNDTLYGGDGNDRLITGDGEDIAYGGSGDDQINGWIDPVHGYWVYYLDSPGSQQLYGEDGNDFIRGSEYADRLFGGLGNDTLLGRAGNDLLDGGAGNDTLYGDAGNDLLDGGSGNDELWDQSSGNDTLVGGAGDDKLMTYLSIGDDSLDGGQGNDDIQGGQGNDTLIGGDGNDNLGGWEGNDSLDGGTGDDSLSGGSGNDTLFGGQGNDELHGGNGDDVLNGGLGNDKLWGDDGNDTYLFSKGDGSDTISNYDATGTNTDRVQFVDTRSSDVLGVERVGDDLLIKYGTTDQVVVTRYFSGVEYKIKTFEFSDGVIWTDADIRSRAITNGTSGDDTLWGSDGGPNHIFGLGGNDIIWGANGNDLIDGGTGNDQLRTGGGSDVVNGGDGDDWVNCVVNSSGEGAFYSYSGTATIDGDAGNDYLNGTSGDDSIVGGLGNDQLFGGDGNDTLNGGSGSDVIWGGNGNDLIDSGLGDDQISTGGGSDAVNGGDGNDWVNCVLNADGSIGYYTYSGNATIDGGAGNDYLTGTTGDDVVIGGLGDDHLSGHDGNDSLDGGLGDDNISGWAGNDTLIGGAGNDDLSGNEGDDSLAGGDGNDTLAGGIGNDTLDGGDGVNFVNGGDGNDTYVIHNRNTFIEDSGGIDTALVSVSFAKIPGSIENVQYIDGALKLPNWLDALTNPSFSGAQLTRMDSSKTFNFNFAPTLPSYQSASYGNGFKQFTAAQIAYALRALDSVANLIDVNFLQTNNSDALNTITFANNSQTDSWGYAFGPYEMFYGSDVFINGDVDVLLNPTKYADSFVGVFNHELGHALGLPHPHENTPTLATGDDNGLATIMGYSRPTEIVDFEVLDIAALQYIYGPSKKVRVGNDTYTVSAASSNFIWDGAGTDTLSASSQTQPVTLYLEPGYWGYVGSKATNITAAGQVTVNFGTVIENLIGGSGNDSLYGNTADNTITGNAGNDSIDGGVGTDTAVYSGSRSSFTLTKAGTGFGLIDKSGTAGTDTLLNVERIKFSDGYIALDVGATQSAGETQLLLGAVLGRDLLATKQPLIGAVIDLFDHAYTLQQLSGAVMRLPIWDALTGKAAPTSTDIANYLLWRVNGVTPDASTLASAVSALDAQPDINHNQGDFLWHLAESAANQAQVGLVGLVATGLAFTV